MDSFWQDRRARPPGLRLSGMDGPDGCRLRRYDWPAGARPRGSLLFQTGRGDFMEKYLEPMAHWHARGWGLSGFDWRGQGGSARAPSGSDHADDLDAMVADVADHARRWIGGTPGPHVVIGHSMGGHLLLRMLAEQHVEVTAAVLVAPMLGLAHAPLPAGVVRRLAGIACAAGLGGRPLWGGSRLLGRQARLTACGTRYADELWWRRAEPALTVGAPGWRWVAAALDSIDRLAAPGVLEGVRTPVLLVASDHDRLVSAPAIRRAAGRLPDAKLCMIDGAHELLREADGVRLAALAAIDAFLDERAPAW